MPDLARFLLEPRQTLEALAESEGRLRAEYVRISLPTRRTRRAPFDLPLVSAQILELNLALCVFAEAAAELGILRGDEIARRVKEIAAKAHEVTGWDPLALLAESWRAVSGVAHSGHISHEGACEAFEQLLPVMLRSVDSTVRVCPIDAIVMLARASGRDELAHRCRVAFDALIAFLRRHDSKLRALEKIVGRAYTTGDATLGEAAAALGLSVPDCVAFLEEHGYRRTPAVVKLADEERTAILRRIRADRRRRGGQPAPSPELARRDVIASQRIEGVDARPWL